MLLRLKGLKDSSETWSHKESQALGLAQTGSECRVKSCGSYFSVVLEEGALFLPRPRAEAILKASITGRSSPFLGGSTITTSESSSQLIGDCKR